MSILEYFKMATGHMKKDIVRSGLTVLGIVIGISTMISVIAVGNAGQHMVKEELNSFGIDKLYIYPSESRDTGVLKKEDVEVLKDRVDGIKSVSAEIYWRGNVKGGGRSSVLSVSGTYPETKDGDSAGLTDGRFLNNNDVRYARDVIVLSSEAASELFGSASAVGKTVEIYGRSFSVIGVEESGAPIYSSFVAEKSYMPITTFEDAFNMESLDEISILVEDPNKVEEVSKEASTLLVKKYGERAIEVLNLSEQVKNANNIIDTFTLVIGAIAFLSLLVGGIGIMNIMLVTVRERTREIGIRKALGARDSDIRKQFLSEAVMYAFIGAGIGIVMGAVFTAVAGEVIGLGAFVPLYSIVLSVGFSAAVGVVFGMLPAAKAAKLDPVAALKGEG